MYLYILIAVIVAGWYYSKTQNVFGAVTSAIFWPFAFGVELYKLFK